jgi:hypothetical protein
MMNTERTLRLARVLSGVDRESAHYDLGLRQKLPFNKRGVSLARYRGRKDVFVSFTSIPKLGINPGTQYNTPVGVYSYPLSYILGSYNMDSGVFDVPFAGDQPYAIAFEVSGIDRALVFDRKDSNQARKAKNLLNGDNDEELFGTQDISRIRQKIDLIDWFVSKTITELPTKHPSYMKFEERQEFLDWHNEWLDRLQKETGLDLQTDEVAKAVLNSGYLDLDILWQATIDTSEGKARGLDKGIIESAVMEVVTKKRVAEKVTFPFEEEIKKLQGHRTFNYLEIKAKVIEERLSCDQGFVWNMTRHLSGFSNTRWTGLLRRLGFIGAIDHGTETIHPNEPTQAVFSILDLSGFLN